MARDPYFKIALMNLVYMLFVLGFVALSRGRHSIAEGFRPAMAWGASALLLMSEMPLVFNIFGTEGGAASALFLFPCSRRQILIGKNLALFAALSVVNFVLLGVLAGLAGALPTFGTLFCWSELAVLVFIAGGNLVSIWFPFRAVARGWRMRQQMASKGCAFQFLYLSASMVAFTLLLPVAAMLLVPTFWASRAWLALTIPVAVAYAGGLYLLSLRLAEPLLMRRELAIVDGVSASEE